MSELPADLRRRLEEVAAEDAPAVLEEARDAARHRARDLLADELVRALLQRVAPEDPRSAAADGDGWGVYVYCVLEPGAAEPRLEIRGVADGTVTLVDDRGLIAVTSAVPLAEFGDEPLRENLNRLDWLEATAQAHEAVVRAAFAAAPAVPMRLCTIFRDAAAVRTMLADEREHLLGTLARVRGRTEWGLKVLADRGRVDAAVTGVAAGHGDAEALGEGAGYLAARRAQRATEDERDAAVQRWVGDAHERLAGLAVEARVNRPTSRELGGYEGDMVLNAAYLVDDEREPELRATVGALAEEHAEHGLRLELTGPWPPHNFTAPA